MGEEFNQPRQEKIKLAEFDKDHKSSAKYRKRFDQSDYIIKCSIINPIICTTN